MDSFTEYNHSHNLSVQYNLSVPSVDVTCDELDEFSCADGRECILKGIQKVQNSKCQISQLLGSRSVFILSNTPIITTDSRCDGYEDCFDQSDEVGCEEIEIGASNNTVEDDYYTNDLYENEDTT